MLDQIASTPAGRVVVEGSLLETLRKLQQGDGLLGWEGDPNMQLFVNLESGLFDVWTLGADGQPALVVSECPYADQRLIERVIKADGRRFDVVGRIIAHNQSLDAARRAENEARNDELADKMHFALRRDLGAYEGGLSRRIY